MPPKSAAAIERKRERGRQWHRKQPKKYLRTTEIEGEDEHWIVLTCSRCFRLFDVPQSRYRLRELCDDCLKKGGR